MPTVNYVVAMWTGTRAHEDTRARVDRTFFMREHIRALEALEHSLDQITVVLAEGGDAEADAFIKSIDRIGDTPVKVLVRENTGYSYASWNHAFETFRDAFDYYILIEDDYIPWADGFDEILVAHAKEKNTYVCSLATRGGRHGAISNGIVPSKVWEKVHPAPFAHGSETRNGNDSQRQWTMWFAEKGFWVKDHTDTHSSPFWNGHSIRWYGDLSKPVLMMPIHAARRFVKVTTRGGPTVRVRSDSFGSYEIYEQDAEAWADMVAASLPGGAD